MADDKEDDLYESVARMADRLKLEGEERGRYIHEHMTRGGYRAVPQYVRDEGDEDGGKSGGSSFFSGGRRRSSGDGGRSKSRRDQDDDWYSG